MTDEKKTAKENTNAQVEKSKSDKKETSPKPSAETVTSTPDKTKIKAILIPVFFGAILGAIISFLLSFSLIPRLPIMNELKAGQEKSIKNYDNLSVQMNELKKMIADIEGNIQEEVNIVPIVSKLEELGKKMQEIEKYDFSQTAVSIEKIEALIDDRTKILSEDISSLGTKIDNNIPDDVPIIEESSNVSLDEALLSMQKAILAGLPFQKALKEYEQAGGDNAPAIIKSLAKTGVATQFDLVQTFPQYARRLLKSDQINEPVKEEGGLDITKFLKKFVKTRSTSPQLGNSSDAILSRAEYAVKNGDIKKALEELDQLPSHLQNEIRDWYMDASIYQSRISFCKCEGNWSSSSNAFLISPFLTAYSALERMASLLFPN